MRAGGELSPSLPARVGMGRAYLLYQRYLMLSSPALGLRPRLRATTDIGYAAGISGRYGNGSMAGGGGSGETAYPVRKALGFTAGQWERVRAFRFEHRFATEAEAVRRLLDLGMEAVGGGLLPAHAKGQDQSPSPGGGGASS